MNLNVVSESSSIPLFPRTGDEQMMKTVALRAFKGVISSSDDKRTVPVVWRGRPGSCAFACSGRTIAIRVILLAGLFSAPLATLRSAEPDVTPSPVTVTGHDFNRPDPFPGLGGFAWPGNIVRQPDGEWLLVHSAGYYHVSFAEPQLIEPGLRKAWLAEGWPLDFPAPTGGRSMMVRSHDQGRTWSKPTTLIDLPLDDSPHGLLRCEDGTLLCFISVQASWYGFPEAPPSFKGDLGGLNTRQAVIRSEDGGRNWSVPIWIESPGDFYERCHAQPIVLPSGRILLPTYFSKKNDTRLYGALHASDDNGRSWRLLATITRDRDGGVGNDLAAGSGKEIDFANESGANIDEPAITSLPDGSLLLITRPDGGRFTSADEGRTWKFTGRLVTKGKLKAPRLFVLKDGTVVCVCTYRNLQVFLGTAAGTNWVGPFDLDPNCYGYPGGMMLDDESMLVSYCSSGRAPNRIHLLRFRVNEQRTGVELLPVSAH